jgi:uncharacterized protein (DUF302 family)
MRLLAALMLSSLTVAPQNEGLVRVRSTRDFTQTVHSLDSAITAAKLRIFSRVDHAANARGVTRPTANHGFIFGGRRSVPD